jgi:hypothetical protein
MRQWKVQGTLQFDCLHITLKSRAFGLRSKKGWTVFRNVSCGIESVICKEIFKAMEKKVWLPLCGHVKETEHRYRVCEIILDDKIDSIIINLGVMYGNSDFDDSRESSASGSDGVLYEIVELQNSD